MKRFIMTASEEREYRSDSERRPPSDSERIRRLESDVARLQRIVSARPGIRILLDEGDVELGKEKTN